MAETLRRAVAIVGVGAVLPDAPDAPTFWKNLENGRYSISDVQPDRWDPALYYDPDPKAPDRSYSKIGGWVREWSWDPLQWRMPIPPRVGEAMDRAQKWAIIGAREALADYGYPERPLDPDRMAVIFGNAMAGDQHYMTALRVFFPEYARELGNSPSFTALPDSVQSAVTGELHERILDRFPDINEDTMPGELANIIAGRVAAVFDFHGPNYIVDAACASAMAGMTAAIEGLENFDFDAVVTGGIDANMSASSFIKFCKIGALSPSGTRPYSEGADGFVMGEGAAIFLLRRLEDAVRDDDRIYAVIRGFGGASDGKGKGITAPNPIGQRLAVERAWNRSALRPVPGDLMEGHGTSTAVGDVVEVESMGEALRGMDLPVGSIPLGSVKSNIGHLKGAAGAAGMLKAALSLHHKMLPPSLGVSSPNPNIDWGNSPFYVNTELQPWEKNNGELRRAGVSAFGFGGTNFHMVLEEYVPGITEVSRKTTIAVGSVSVGNGSHTALKAPPRGALVLGADDRVALAGRIEEAAREAESGEVLPPKPPWEADLAAPVRVAIDYVDAEDLIKKAPKALKELKRDRSAAWSASRAQGMFVDEGEPPKVAFLYTGQGSQYVNMLAEFRDVEPIVAETFAEADRIMTPLLGRPLTDYIFIDEDDAEAMARASEDLRQTEITQPAVLTVDVALTRLLAAYGITPDMVMGHSLGEYGALVGAGALSFADALEAVSARGQGMAQVAVDDNGTMAAILGPLEEIERIVDSIDGYVVVANINSTRQAVIGGATDAVDAAIEACQDAGFRASKLPVSHAFHTEIVAPAIDPLREVLGRLDIQSPALPIIANISGDFYPMGPDVSEDVIDILGRQIASPVQFVAGLSRLYEAGARVFVEVGPKSALHGFVKDVLGEHDDSRALFTNHPKQGDLTSFNRGLCGLYAAGLGLGRVPGEEPQQVTAEAEVAMPGVAQPMPQLTAQSASRETSGAQLGADNYMQLGRIFAEAIQQGMKVFSDEKPAPAREMLVISGASLGLPGTEHVFDDANVSRILSGEQFIDAIPMEFRQAMVDKNITRLVKGPNGEARFELIEDTSEAIKLAARGGIFDLAEEYGFPEDRLPALDTVTELAIGAGIDALRDAGIPLVRHYKTTTKGTKLPDRWCLPEEMQDDTGVIFASAFPGYDALLDEVERFHGHTARREQLENLLKLQDQLVDRADAEDGLGQEIESQIQDLQAKIGEDPYIFDRRFLFKVLAFGHAQFAEMIAARGPNTQVNAACASGGQALGLAEDWIRGGRCRRVVVISADNTTSDNLIKWIGAGFLASGAAATDEDVEDAAIPFDKRRHGLIIGMGAGAMVLETAGSVAERGMQPICEVLGTAVANSAFHGSRLDVHHIAKVMEAFVADAEAHYGIDRRQIAPHTVFVSHETYTPARGGSAQAEATALQQVFGDVADQILVANTKGFTGHPMGVGIEEVVAVKILETGIVPPVANHRELDPELGYLNLSRGGDYPVQFALRLAAGFGSQLAMSLLRWVPTSDEVRQSPLQLGHAYRITDPATWNQWLQRITGYASPQVELENRTLRVKDEGPTVLAAPPSRSDNAAQDLTAPSGVVAPAAIPPAAVAIPPTSVAPPAVPDAPPVPPAAAPPEAPAASDPVEEKILELVTEQTGYPPDMLDLDLDLEADLGVDTVKQAEMFAAIREAYDIPREDDLQLRDFPTLNDVVRFVYERRPDLGGPPEVAEAAATSEVSEVSAPPLVPEPATAPVVLDPVQVKILELVTEQTGYPPDMLDMDLDLEADLGVDTVKQAEMFAAIRGAYDIPRDDELQLRDFPTLNDVVRFVYERRPDLVAPLEADEESVASAVTDIVPVSTDTALAPADLMTSVAPDAAFESPTDEPTVVESASGPESWAAADAVTDPVALKVLELIAAKTGYPADMLEMDLDLEADLGIDTVKQAEMFASVRAEYDIPRDDELQLRDFPTLNDVVRFVYERRPAVAEDLREEVDVPLSEEPEDDGGRPDMVPEEDGDQVDMMPEEVDTLPEPEMEEGVEDYSGVLPDDLKAAVQAAMDAVAEVTAEVSGVEVEPDLDDSVDETAITELGEFTTEETAAAGSDEPAEEVTASEIEEPDRGEIPGLIEASMEAAESIPRRVPVPVLRPSLDLCKETGVEFGPDSRVLIMSDIGGVGESLAIRLERLGARVLTIEDTPTCEELEARLSDLLRGGPIQGVYWLPALDHEGDLRKLDPESWHAAVHTRVKLLYTAMRALYQQIGEPGTFLVSATRLGGLHGYDEQGAVSPLGGAVAGLTKTFKRERPDALVKVVDFEPSQKTAAEAEVLIQETLRDPGAVEIGNKDDRRWTVALEERSLDGEVPGLELGPETVFVVTGAAGSIVSSITADLAKASGGIFYLLDLVPEPDIDDPEIDRVVNDRENLKRDLFERINERGERATPALVDRELAGLERSQSAAAAIRAVRDAGGEVHYHSVNLLDADSVARVIDEVQEHDGRIDVLLHAAGLEISHMMPDKDPKEFNLVFDVKADGWFNLLHAIGDMPLAATVVFSSIAGRFGNAGQADYSAANDLLCKITSSFRSTRPETRGIAIDWTAWGGIGMATRGSIPLVMKEAGIDMLPPEAGVAVIRRELTTGDWRGEVMIAERLGILLEEWDETGGLDIDGLVFPDVGDRGVMVGEVDGMGLYDGLTVKTTLDPGVQAFLHDHQIEGTPVLPGVMGIEAFAEAARLPFPDLHVAAVEDVDFLAPFKFYRGEPRTVTVQAIYRTEGDDVVADCKLLGSRTLVGQEEPQVVTHFTGRVRLSAEAPTAPDVEIPPPPEGDPISASDIYKIYFHGPAYQVIEGAWRVENGLAGLWAEDLPDNHMPATMPTVMEPRLIEFCVQMSSLWDLGVNGRMGLPRHLDRVSRMHSLDEAEGGLYVLVRPDPAAGFEACVVDDTGKVCVTVSGYRTVELPVGLDPELLQPLREGMAFQISEVEPTSDTEEIGAPEQFTSPEEALDRGSDAGPADDKEFGYGSEVDEMPDPDEDGTW